MNKCKSWKDVVENFIAGKSAYCGNTASIRTSQNSMVLALCGNVIATRYGEQQSLYAITNAGCNTKTANSRLNMLPGVNVTNRRGKLYLNGVEWCGGRILV